MLIVNFSELKWDKTYHYVSEMPNSLKDVCFGFWAHW